MKTEGVSRRAGGQRPGWRDYVRRVQGSTVRFDLSGYDAPLSAIAALEAVNRDLTDEELCRRSEALRDRARAGEARDALRVPLYALAREASRRVLGQRPFDVQVVAALALGDDQGHVVEMLTGEGKTLTAVMPAALNALEGRGAHVLTFNDYLARRDAEWMGPVYRLLGLSVGHVQEGLTAAARRAAYHADVTYVTAKEAGFDHLRDLLGDTLLQNFSLGAGFITSTPDSLEVTMTLGTSDTLPLALTNEGGVAASFEITKQDGGMIPANRQGAPIHHRCGNFTPYRLTAPLASAASWDGKANPNPLPALDGYSQLPVCHHGQHSR